MPTILCIDDHPDVTGIVQDYLGSDGYTVLGAETPLDGIPLAREQKPDVILMDDLMPGMHGWDATRELKADPLTASIPVIMSTSFPFSRTIREEAGCDGFLTKPWSQWDLLREVKRVMAGGTLDREAIQAYIGYAVRESEYPLMEAVRLQLHIADFDQARETLARIEPEWPANYITFYTDLMELAQRLVKKGKLEEVNKLISNLASNPQPRWATVAALLEGLGRREEADQAAEKIQDPDFRAAVQAGLVRVRNHPTEGLQYPLEGPDL